MVKAAEESTSHYCAKKFIRGSGVGRVGLQQV